MNILLHMIIKIAFHTLTNILHAFRLLHKLREKRDLMNKKEELLPILAGLLVAVIFGFSFTFTKGALELLDPFHLLGLRFLFASSLLWILRLFNVIKINFSGRRMKPLFFLTLFQPILYFICEVTGVDMTSASESGMMISLIPVVAAILGVIFLNEKPSKKQWFFIFLSVAGVIFITIMRESEVEGNYVGMLVLLGAVFSAGAFNILSRKSSLYFNAIEITFFMMMVGLVVFNGIAITDHIVRGEITHYFTPLLNLNALVAVTYLGILSSVVAFFMLNFMLSKIEATKSAVFGNLVTVVSIIAGILVLGEPFYWFHIVGAILILLGVWGTNYYGIKPGNRKPSVEQKEISKSFD